MSIPWYSINHPEQTDSPALLVYPERILHNIRKMIRIAGSPDRLVPHVKTHKMSAVVKMQLEAGISRFKCATIAEAEMLAKTGRPTEGQSGPQASVKSVLVAYQLNETKALRLLQLVKQYPTVHFASLVDNTDSARMLNDLFAKNYLTATVYIDVDNGMHRTGLFVGNDVPAFYQQLTALKYLYCKGLHVYDGHIREPDFEERKKICEAAFTPVMEAARNIEATGSPAPEIIAGGSPTFPVHALNPHVLCSPGTSLLWDEGYANQLPEQPFLRAAVLLTRIISKQQPRCITTDLGHKSIAAENPVARRIFFLSPEGCEAISQSEEHLVVKVNDGDWDRLKVGDELYGIPYHICPTVALYDEVQVVQKGEVTGQWQVEARRKRITI